MLYEVITDVYQKRINKKVSDKKLVRIGKLTSTILAAFAIFAAPMVADAPDGLYQLLQQLNGIFFIPIASIMLAGFFLNGISATGAKAALFVGLLFYILTTFVFQVNIHFVHLWGIEFLLNLAVMFVVSYFYPATKTYQEEDLHILDMKAWKYTKPMAIALCVVTVIIYVLLGSRITSYNVCYTKLLRGQFLLMF